MQLSELFRRGVFHPIGEKSREKVESWDIQGAVQVRLFSIPDDNCFYQLLEIGVFTAINERLSCNIDDYEEESIGVEQFEQLEFILKDFQNKYTANSGIKFCLTSLIELTESAKKENMPLFFIF